MSTALSGTGADLQTTATDLGLASGDVVGRFPSESPLPPSQRLRATLVGIGLGALALTLATAGGLAITAGPFHTALESLA